MLDRLKSAFLVLGGAGLVVAGMWFAVDTARFVAEAARADGRVVGIVAKRVRGSTLYRPVVRFQPGDRPEPVEFTAEPALWGGLHDVGDRVRVAYRSDDPADAKVESFWMLWFLPLVCALLGAACLFAGRHERRRYFRSQNSIQSGG